MHASHFVTEHIKKTSTQMLKFNPYSEDTTLESWLNAKRGSY
jgi:hypothetical protein